MRKQISRQIFSKQKIFNYKISGTFTFHDFVDQTLLTKSFSIFFWGGMNMTVITYFNGGAHNAGVNVIYHKNGSVSDNAV